MNLRFDPRELVALGDAGTVYPTMRVSDEWVVLEISHGALMKDFSRIAVPAPTDPAARPLAGDGWQLEVKEGWDLTPGSRPGDYRLERSGP